MLSLGLVLSLLFIDFGPLSKGAEQNQPSVQEKLTRCKSLRVLKMLRYLNDLATVFVPGFQMDTADSWDFRALHMLFGLATVHAAGL